MSGAADDKARLVGTWTMVSGVREEIPSGAKTDQFGPNPHGFITYDADGRMMAIITRANAPPRPHPRDDGRDRGVVPQHDELRGDVFDRGTPSRHDVDISWNQSFTGSKQKRFFTFEGDRLILSTPQSTDPIDGKLSVRHMTWQRVR